MWLSRIFPIGKREAHRNIRCAAGRLCRIMKYAETILDLVGNTPLVKLNHVTEGIAATVLVKLEYLNPGGSSKDRIATRIIDAAERDGQLKPGGTIVEPTTGNTGVGLALVAQQRGYRCVFVLPDKVGEDKRNVLTAYGAEIVVTPDLRRPRQPRVVLQRLRPAGRARSPARSSPTSTPTRTARSATTRRPAPRSGATPTAGHALRRRRRHRRHDHRHRPLPARRSPDGARADHRRRPRGLGLLGRHRPPLPRRGRRRGLLADRLRPAPSSTRSSPSPTPSRSTMTRRLAREEGMLVGGSSGMAVVAPSRPRATCRRRRRHGRPAARRRPRLPRQDLQRQVDALATGSARRRPAHTSPTSSARRAASCPALVHVHPSDTVRDAIDMMTEFGVSQLPVLTAEPPVVHGRGASARSTSARCIDARLHAASAQLTDTVARVRRGAAAADRRATSSVDAAARTRSRTADALLVHRRRQAARRVTRTTCSPS